MERILDQNIKELINAYPAIGSVLNAFKIACITCSSGSCKLRDIIEIHTLSVEDEYKLFKQIANIVYPSQNVEIPRLPRKNEGKKKFPSFSPPVQMLVDEHSIIKKVIASIPLLIERARADFEQEKPTLQEALRFIRLYADKFHHAKEEDLLFKLFDERSDIISTMYEEHEIGRAYIRKVAASIDTGDIATISENLSAYRALLTEHIQKEDNILYPWMDSRLSDTQIGILFSKFIEIASRNSEATAIGRNISKIIGR